MSMPPPSIPPSTGSLPSTPQARHGDATGHVIAQTVGVAGLFGLITVWTALGASGAAMLTGLCAVCLAVPFLGWFIGLPMVLAFGMVAVMFWVLVLFALVAAWASAAFAVAVLAMLHRLRN